MSRGQEETVHRVDLLFYDYLSISFSDLEQTVVAEMLFNIVGLPIFTRAYAT